MSQFENVEIFYAVHGCSLPMSPSRFSRTPSGTHEHVSRTRVTNRHEAYVRRKAVKVILDVGLERIKAKG